MKERPKTFLIPGREEESLDASPVLDLKSFSFNKAPSFMVKLFPFFKIDCKKKINYFSLIKFEAFSTHLSCAFAIDL